MILIGIVQSLSKALGIGRELNIEEVMDAAEEEDVDVLHQSADFYIKPIALQTEEDLKVIEEELKQKNIVLLNITPIARNPARLKTAVSQLRTFVAGLNGDIARIDEDKILLTPQNVKIVKRRKQ